MLVNANLLKVTEYGTALAEFSNATIEIEEDESVSEMYMVVVDTYENGKLVGTELPSVLKVFTDSDTAWGFAEDMANAECDSLNESESDKLISYGIVDKECNGGGYISTNKYALANEFDTTGETDILTAYRVVDLCVVSEVA